MSSKFMEQFEKDAQDDLIKTSLANDPDLKFDDPNIAISYKQDAILMMTLYSDVIEESLEML